VRSTRKLKKLMNIDATINLAMYAAAAGAGLAIVLIGGMFADFLKVEVQIWLAALLASMLHATAVEHDHSRATTEHHRGMHQAGAAFH
jgi:hypothetical protein